MYKLVFCVFCSLCTLTVTERVSADAEAVVIGEEDRQGNTAVFRVNLATGQRSLMNSFPGLLYDSDHSIAVSSSGLIYLTMTTGPNIFYPPALFSVDPRTGNRKLISPFDQISYGPVMYSGAATSVSLAVAPDGSILAYAHGPGLIISINPNTGARAVLSDADNAVQGPAFDGYAGMSVDRNGHLLVSSQEELISGYQYFGLLDVNAVTGVRTAITPTVIKQAYSYCPYFSPNAIKLADSTGILLCEIRNDYSYSDGFLRSYDFNSGVAGTISNYTDYSQGPRIYDAKHYEWGPGDEIYALDYGDESAGSVGGIYSINQKTGARTLISDFINPDQGPVVNHARDFAIGVLPEYAGNGNIGGTISLRQTELADPVNSGETFSYTLDFTNSSDTDLVNVKLTDILPSKINLSSIIPSQGSCKGKAKVICKLGTMAPGSTSTIEIKLTHKKPGNKNNKVVVTYKALEQGTKKKKSFKVTSIESTSVL